MKKLGIILILLATLMIGTRATYAENGWATAGKVLTGVFAADILFNHVGPVYPGYGYAYGPGYSYGYAYGCGPGYAVGYYAGPPVYYAPAPVYGYRSYYRYPRYYRGYPSRRW